MRRFDPFSLRLDCSDNLAKESLGMGVAMLSRLYKSIVPGYARYKIWWWKGAYSRWKYKRDNYITTGCAMCKRVIHDWPGGYELAKYGTLCDICEETKVGQLQWIIRRVGRAVMRSV